MLLDHIWNVHCSRSICDIIKRNESDIRNIDFELQAKRGDKFLFYIVFEVKELFIFLELDVWLRWDLDQSVAF